MDDSHKKMLRKVSIFVLHRWKVESGRPSLSL
jgi:hypothetical protein